MPLTREHLGDFEGKPVERFTLTSPANITVKIINYGGRIAQIRVPDRDGKIGDVNLGYDDLASYLTDKNYFGALVGPVANRIAHGKFVLNGKTYVLNPAGSDSPTLHGGAAGFQKVLWEPTPAGDCSLKLTYTHPDGLGGFPGNLACTVTYQLDGRKLIIDYTARTDIPTPVNLTNHAYFNLAGPGSGTVLEHEVTIAAGSYTPVDATLIPTGKLANVQDTPMDFRKPQTIGARIAQLGTGHGQGYDHNYVLDSRGDAYRMAASVREPKSGRVLNVYTTEPGLQFYSGNFLDGTVSGIGGKYQRHSAFCMEAQQFPDAINQPSFPSPVLQPGEDYRQTTTYEFTTDRDK